MHRTQDAPSPRRSRSPTTSRELALRFLLLGTLALLSVSSALAQTDPAEGESPRVMFNRGTNFFDYGDCEGAARLLSQVASPEALENEDELMDAHRMLGICYHQLDKPEKAADHFKQLLYLDPTHELDPFKTPPPTIELFRSIRLGIEKELEELEKAREDTETKTDGPQPSLLVERVRTVEMVPFLSVFMPFGAAQAAHHQPLWKTALFGGVQAALAVATLTTAGLALSVDLQDGSFGDVPVGEKSTRFAYQLIWGTHLASWAAFVVSYAVSVGDAWLARDEAVVIKTEESRRQLSADEARKMLRPMAPE